MKPHELAAHYFMEHKGYPSQMPTQCVQRDRFTWLFLYELDEGDLELQVQWLEDGRTWNVTVQDFALVD